MAQLEGRERSQYVQEMFGRIASRYVLMNSLMTFGQDKRWREFVIAKANLKPKSRLLDIATGTGDIALEALAHQPQLDVVGVDFALPMMQVGKQCPNGDALFWCQGDALQLPFDDNSFDVVVSGYLLRNVINIKQCMQEQLRVVRPGGIIIALDTTPPPNNILRPFIQFHLKAIIPLLGRLISGAADAYTYLPESTQAFKSAEELKLIWQGAGLVDVEYKKFMFGTMAVHWAQKR